MMGRTVKLDVIDKKKLILVASLKSEGGTGKEEVAKSSKMTTAGNINYY